VHSILSEYPAILDIATSLSLNKLFGVFSKQWNISLGETPCTRGSIRKGKTKMTMRLLSVNVGQPRQVVWKGRTVTTGIFKEPVAGRVPLRRHNLDGDAQADLSVHGGPYKAVYLYPAEHYAAWRQELPDMALPWGMFGENFTTEGILEATMHIGDRLRIGTAVVRVTEPRMPCYKLGLRFGRDDILKRFLASGRTGLYVAVEHEGEVEAGETFTLLSRDNHGVTVADITRVYAHEKDDVDTMQRLVHLPNLSAPWRAYFQEQLHKRG
jgi:MOSC domain-containing protein YiiM